MFYHNFQQLVIKIIHTGLLTQKQICQKKCGINKISEGNFPLLFKIIDIHQWGNPSLMDKLKCTKYKIVFLWIP